MILPDPQKYDARITVSYDSGGEMTLIHADNYVAICI